MSDNMIEKARTAASSLKNRISEIREDLLSREKDEIIKEFREKGEGKIREVVETLNRYRALFLEAGYSISSVNASLSVPPDITIVFNFLGAIEENKRQQILNTASGDKIISILLTSLFKSTDFAQSVKIGDMKLNSIDITLGLIPSISISIS